MEDRYLFKAKRLDNGEWVKGALVYDDMDKLYRMITEIDYSTGTCMTTDKAPRVDASTICQCTGLKDKNNNLIYENDILDGFTYPYMTDGVHNYYAEICWCTNIPAFGTYTRKYPESKVSGISAGMTELMEDWNPNDWEVIGNIFDNPKLLESERQYERE